MFDFLFFLCYNIYVNKKGGKIMNNEDLKLLGYLLKLNQKQLLKKTKKVLKKNYNKVVATEDYVYAVGDIPIALVAHLDTVFSWPPENIFFDKNQKIVWSPEGLGADDRAGVFAIFKILQTGLRPHIIFTTDEERGGLGASALVDNKKCPFENLNYIIELDRRGSDDCVFYDCDNPEFSNYISNFGFKVQQGSFSDISFICPEWKIAGVNLSIGYYNEHSLKEYLKIEETYATIEKVKNMLQEVNIPKFEYIEKINSYLYEKCAFCGKHYSIYRMDLIPNNNYYDYICFDCEKKLK